MATPVSFVRDVVRNFSEDECTTHAAALSYYTVFALGPTLVLLVSLVGLIVDPDAFRAAMSGQLGTLLGADAAGLIQSILDAQARDPDTSLVARGVSTGVLLLGATTVFVQLRTALNRIWGVGPGDERGGPLAFVVKRLLSLGMVAVMGFLMLVSLAMSAILSGLGEALEALVPWLDAAGMQGVGNALTVGIFAVLFAAIFKFLPEARIGWKDVGFGAVITAVLFTVGKWAIGLYLGRSDLTSGYGAAGSLAVLLVWVYYSSVILFLGAEITQVWAQRVGGGIRTPHRAD